MKDYAIRRGSLEMTAAMLVSGTVGWFVLMSGQSVLDVVFWRCVFGAGTLLVICFAMGFLRPGSITAKGLAWAVVSGAAIVANWVLLFAAYSGASIGVATAVYNTQPFMLVGLGALFLGERITFDKITWLSLAFVGMLAITQEQGAPQYGQGSYLVGIGLSLGAAFCYAVAALLVKRLTGTSPHLIALIQVCTGIVLIAPFANVAAWPSLPSTAWMCLAAMGVIHTGLVYVLLYSAIQRLPTAVTGALSFIYPIVAILVDWFAFDHVLGWLQWVGVAAILFAAGAMRQGWRPQTGLRALRRRMAQSGRA